MNDANNALGAAGMGDETALAERIMKLVEERFDVEALAQLVEHQDFSRGLSRKLTERFGRIQTGLAAHDGTIAALQAELRDLIMDVALLKRALVSLGHVGAMKRHEIERRLVLELFPPSRPGRGTGVRIMMPVRGQAAVQVNCAERLSLCKAACCRILNTPLTSEEVESDRYEWDPRLPYHLRKGRIGCVHLRDGACSCSIHAERPEACRAYSCRDDPRIWADFEKMVVNPDLAKRLELLDVVTVTDYDASSSKESHAGAAPSSDHVSADSDGAGPTSASRSASVASDSSAGFHGLGGLGATGASSDRDVAPVSARPAVQPPDFDELRRMFVPKPARPFRIPKSEETEGQPVSTSGPPSEGGQ